MPTNSEHNGQRTVEWDFKNAQPYHWSLKTCRFNSSSGNRVLKTFLLFDRKWKWGLKRLALMFLRQNTEICDLNPWTGVCSTRTEKIVHRNEDFMMLSHSDNRIDPPRGVFIVLTFA